MTEPDRRLGRRELLRAAAAAGVVPFALSQESARARMPFVDGLSFPPPHGEDLRASGLAAFIWDCSSGEVVKGPGGADEFRRTFLPCMKSIARARRTLRGGLPGAFLATRGSEIAEAARTARTAVFLQFQGCEPLEGDLDRMEVFYELGLRVLQITHHFDNAIGGGALEKKPTGLTKLGFEAVERMNALGIIPDLSHASDATSFDVLKTSKQPVIVSHGGARALVANANPRCSPDDVIAAVAKSGGVFGVFMMSFWLTTDPVPTIDHLIAQIRHVIKVGGLDAVGIANDFSVSGEMQAAAAGNDNAKAVANYHGWWKSIRARGVPGFEELPLHVVIPELNDVRRMFTIRAALEKAGFRPSETEKIMGGNWTRVLTESLG